MLYVSNFLTMLSSSIQPKRHGCQNSGKNTGVVVVIVCYQQPRQQDAEDEGWQPEKQQWEKTVSLKHSMPLCLTFHEQNVLADSHECQTFGRRKIANSRDYNSLDISEKDVFKSKMMLDGAGPG